MQVIVAWQDRSCPASDWSPLLVQDLVGSGTEIAEQPTEHPPSSSLLP